MGIASRSSYERDLKAIQSLAKEKTDSNYRTEIYSHKRAMIA